MNVWKEIEKSALWLKPPLYKQVFLWLLIRADHKGFRIDDDSNWGVLDVQPGQVCFTLDGLAWCNAWYVRNRKKKPNKKTVRDVLLWLEKEGLISVQSNRFFTRVTLTNSAVY
jgi:hypothetical protein